jgi:large subunit ribosomal protein L29
MMQVKEVRELNNEQLAEKLVELKKDLFNLRLQLATNQLDNPVKIRETKKAIARIQTVLRERELGAKA